MFSEEHLYSIALRRCHLIGDVNFYKLLRLEGSAEQVWKSSKRILAKIEGIGSKTVSEIGNSEHLNFAENELKFCKKNNIGILLRHQKELPFLLNECEDSPSILYYKGNSEIHDLNISIVGTRNVTHYGKKFVEDFLKEIQNSKVTSVSGLALGVDTEVHEHSLKNNISTVAVLAHGFHTLYPSKNRKLADKILENKGTLFTEFNSSQKPDRENFIQRNRVIAGLSKATIVVETAFGGGSITTVGFANDYNRDVYALPGKIFDQYSQGCNQLILKNKASAISTIPDLIKDLGIKKNQEKTGMLFPFSEEKLELSESQKLIYKIINENKTITLDDLSVKSEIPSHKILPILLDLELSGYIKSLSGRQYMAI